MSTLTTEIILRKIYKKGLMDKTSFKFRNLLLYALYSQESISNIDYQIGFKVRQTKKCM